MAIYAVITVIPKTEEDARGAGRNCQANVDFTTTEMAQSLARPVCLTAASRRGRQEMGAMVLMPRCGAHNGVVLDAKPI